MSAEAGAGEGPASEIETVDRTAPCDIGVPEVAPVRRLSHKEYENTLRDLFPGLEVELPSLAADRAVHGFENYASQLNPSELLVEQYFAAAEAVAQAVLDRGEAFLPCDPEAGDEACRDAFLSELGGRVLRRPLDSEEAARYRAEFDQRWTEISFRGAAELSLAALLMAPSFAYRIELGGQGGVAERVRGHEMAARLSYFLLQSAPDDALRTAAEEGSLDTHEGIRSEALRMLEDPKATQAIVDFHRQWLTLDRVLTQDKDPTLFPSWDDGLAELVRDESLRLVNLVFTEGEGTFSELLLSRRAEVTGALAELYGVAGGGEEWTHVDLNSAERAGILTRAAFNAGYGKLTNGSPPLRGVAVLDKMFCSHPPAPPPGIDLTVMQDPAAPKTNRELFETKTSRPQCQGCHEQIDGVGFSFEHYDSTGRYRSEDNGMPVNASGGLVHTDVDGPYSDAIGLSESIARSKEALYCSSTQWFRYAFGRDETEGDWCKTDELYGALDASGGDIRSLLLAIVSSPEFQMRLSPEEGAAP